MDEACEHKNLEVDANAATRTERGNVYGNAICADCKARRPFILFEGQWIRVKGAVAAGFRPIEEIRD
jgi:hypothetical protein